MKDIFYSSSYSSTTLNDVKKTQKQAAQDIMMLQKMTQEEAREFLLMRFNIDIKKFL